MESSTLSQRAHLGLSTPAPLLRLQGDERLVALTRRGNHGAYEALVARYHARLLSFCRHMLGSREDAEDVLQDVFAAAFNAILADERAINVRPWLYRIARNRCLNHLRRIQAIGVDSMDVHLAEHGTTTAEKAHDREEFRLLLRDVQHLPESQRTALLLRELDALSYGQIAEAMETTVPSVKSLLVRARVGLAEAAEARLLTCEQVREELGEVAEGLTRISPPVRRHLRECQRCSAFRKQLRETNRALAAIFPLGPLLLLKKFLVAQAGATAGTATVAAGGATVAGSTAAGSALSTGISALATKTAAGLAAAAIVTAGAVEVDHATKTRRQPQPVAAAVAPAVAPVAAPVVIASVAQPSQPVVRRRAERTHAAAPAEAQPAAAAASAPATTAAPAGGVEAPAEPAGTAPPPQEEYDSTTLPQSPSEGAPSGGMAAPEEPRQVAVPTSGPAPAQPAPAPVPAPQPAEPATAADPPVPQPDPAPAPGPAEPPAAGPPAGSEPVPPGGPAPPAP